jgi:DNA gyrase/topoisomerase IV subunit B
MESCGHLKDISKLIFGKKSNVEIPAEMSTIVFFKPDPTIFESCTAEVPVRNLQYFLLIQEKFYGRKANVYVDGQKINNTFKPYKYELVETIKPKDDSFNKQVGIYVTFEVDKSLGPKSEIGSVNGLDVNQGQHITIGESCFKTALKDAYKIKHEYLTNGLQMCVILLAGEVMFDSQTKSRLKSITKVKVTDFTQVVKDMEKIFRKDASYWDLHVSKLNKLAESMKDIGAAELAEKFMSSTSGVGLYRNKASLIPGFTEATGKNRMDCELFITEGLSAAGSLVTARPDTTKFAIMPLRGKILNVTNVSAKRAMESATIYSIFSVIGLGLDVNNVVKDCNTREEAIEVVKQKTRYGKIIIATDADADGSQIANELLHMFGKYASFMVDLGLIYRAISPLWKGKSKTTGKMTYYYPDDPYNQDTGFPVDMDEHSHYYRYKGLTI